MKRSTRWLISISAYYSHLLGVIAFWYDVDTGVTSKKTYLTIYCIIANVTSAASLLYAAGKIKFKSRPTGQPDLHQKIYVVMAIIRIVGVVVTISCNWIKRDDFIRNMNDFQEFRERIFRKWTPSLKYQQLFDRQIRIKLLISVASEAIISIGMMLILRHGFGLENLFVLLIIGLLSTVFNVVSCHYFFLTIQVYILISIMVDQLKSVLKSAGDLFLKQYAQRIGAGVLVTQCCSLSDAVDELSRSHLELQCLCDRINMMFYVQGCCFLLVFYMNSMCLMYMTYMMWRQEDLWPQFDQSIWVLIGVVMLLYYTDVYVYVGLILQTEDVIDMPGMLLKDRQPWLPTLDKRLERSLQNYSLQIAAFPLNRQLMYLFEITRPMVFAAFSSSLLNAIVLMQYDYKHRSG